MAALVSPEKKEEIRREKDLPVHQIQFPFARNSIIII